MNHLGNKEIRFLLSSDMTISIDLRNSDEKTLYFPVKEILSGKKEEDKRGLFLYMEEYINSKGDDFITKVFKEYQIASDTLDELALVNGLEPLNFVVFHRILDLINMNDLYNFLIKVIQIPKDLNEEFVQDANSTLNPIQTYTRTQYAELILLSTMLRFTLPILGKYIYVKSSCINEHLTELIFLPVFAKYHKFKDMPAFIKLEKFAEKAYEKEQTAESDAVRSILYGIPKDETTKWLFACSLILGIMSVSTINDTHETNVIKKIFNSILISKIKKNTDNSKIKDKKKTIGTKGNEENQESVSEACRVTTNLTPGKIEAINWSCESVDFILHQLPKDFSNPKNPINLYEIDKDIALEAYRIISSYSKEELIIIPDSTFSLLGWLFQSGLNHVNAYKYLKKKELYSVISVAYSHLYVNGFKDIALMMLSKRNTEENSYATFNNNATNRSKIPEDLKKELDSYCSLKKPKVVGNGIEELSNAEIGINELSSIMFMEEYITLAKKEHIFETTQGQSPIIIAGNNLKIRLAELLLFIYKRDKKIKL